VRLFIAINLPRAERERIAAATRPLRESGMPVRWVGMDSYHLTLKFLGEVEESTAEQVRKLVEQVAARHPPFPLRLHGAGAFRTPGARPWWLGIESSEALAACSAQSTPARRHSASRPSSATSHPT
jgi:2'-5' RNA ligase